MRKLLSLLLFASLSLHGAELTTPLVSDGQVKVTVADLVAYIDRGDSDPKALLSLLRQPERIEQLANNVFLGKVLASEAVTANLIANHPLQQAKIDDFVNRTHAALRLDEIMQAPIPDMSAAALERYRVNSEQYRTDARVQVQHILLKINESQNREAALTLFNQIKARLQAGESFATLADSYSQDPSVKDNHGDLGWVTQKRDKNLRRGRLCFNGGGCH
ncbi:MAG: peptidylprolyl isomerase [Gammaproteobacteria bacterium]|nr:peptidylprolyl isomerase [Gammaproteobacteria bacterium]